MVAIAFASRRPWSLYDNDPGIGVTKSVVPVTEGARRAPFGKRGRAVVDITARRVKYSWSMTAYDSAVPSQAKVVLLTGSPSASIQ